MRADETIELFMATLFEFENDWLVTDLVFVKLRAAMLKWLNELYF